MVQVHLHSLHSQSYHPHLTEIERSGMTTSLNPLAHTNCITATELHQRNEGDIVWDLYLSLFIE